MKQRGFDLGWMGSAKFAAFMKKDDEEIGEDPEVARAGEVARATRRACPAPIKSGLNSRASSPLQRTGSPLSAFADASAD